MKRILAALLAALLLALPAAAAEADWLVPPIRDYAPFTDTAGTICETAAGICCRWYRTGWPVRTAGQRWRLICAAAPPAGPWPAMPRPRRRTARNCCEGYGANCAGR